MDKNASIFLAGHRWLLGWAILEKLKNEWYTNIILKTRDEVDLQDQNATYVFFREYKPEYVILAAAKVGGMTINIKKPADFLFENLQIQDNVIGGAHLHGETKKLIFLWSSCIYPRNSPQPMKEEYFMDGKVEPTNEAYAIAKIAGMKLCEKIYEQYGKKFISCMPTNIYGPGDNFDPDTSHVIPGMMTRMYEAKMRGDTEFTIWWTGDTRREFLYVTDLADAVVWLLENYEEKQFLNVGTGVDISINELAEILKELIWYEGKFVHDISKPDGFPKKLLDVSKIESLWWKSKVKVMDWLKNTYEWFLEQKKLNLL